MRGSSLRTGSLIKYSYQSQHLLGQPRLESCTTRIRCTEIMSEYEYKKSASSFLESEEEERPSVKKVKPPAKRGPKASGSGSASQSAPPSKRSKEASEWLFGSDTEDEAVNKSRVFDANTCVYTRRVPGGVVRRTAQLDGELQVELRLYNAQEVANLGGIERCEKSVVWLRLRGDGDSAEFNALKKFINKAKERFTEEGTFYGDKKKKSK
ncbi:hypothetical protein NE865_15548 [Phthorimaea operculella]|nr:hypothetical protein NE865_15548 [Phthorimaea operculella]